MKLGVFALLVVTVAVAGPAAAEERYMMQPVVPADKLAEARALKSPVSNSPQVVEKGKTIYNGKGGCFNCHGTDGGGNGPAAAKMNPAPRNFQHHGFWRHRTEGEIFWVIKYGSLGTGMIAFGPVLSDDEIWSVIQYERTFAGGHGRGSIRHGQGMGPMMGGREGMDHRGRRGGMGD